MAFTPIRVAKLAAVCIIVVSQLLVVAALPNAAPDDVKCQQQGEVYEFEGAGVIHTAPYPCNDNPKNAVAGKCILSLPDGIAQCDADPECGGFGITTNLPYHSVFDRPGLIAVELFPKGSPATNNTEWGSFIKTDVNSN